MVKKTKFAFALAGVYFPTLGVIALMGVGLWVYHDARERAAIAAILMQHTGLVFVVPLALLAVQAFLLQLFFRQYLTTPLELAEHIKIILNSNPSHRIEPIGGPELHELVQLINDFADRHQARLRDVDAMIRDAQAKLEEERNRLAALVSELTQSVLVCNIEGRILLYNSRARQLLGRPGNEQSASGGASLVGLGRSVLAIFERSLITHALENVQSRLRKGNPSPVANFVTTAPGGQLIRMQMAPVLSAAEASPGEGQARDRASAITGFVLIMDDVTRAVETGSRKDRFLRSLTEGSRGALASIRAAVETLLAYPEMEPEKRSKFIEIISEEAAGLSGQLDRTAGDYAASLKTEWLLEDMLGVDLISAARKRIETKLGLAAAIDATDSSLWLKVDSHSLMQAITWIARRLKDEFGVRELRLKLEASGRLAHVDLAWSGAAVASEALAAWETQPLDTDGESVPSTPKEILERHDGELLYQVDKASRSGFFRLLIPVTQPEQPVFRAPVTAPGRPEYYDFDLFNQAGQTPELDQRKLTELTYTVFDTETTGLEPSAGDEIMSIGALRIVNGRLLHHDAFEQFVDPKRSVSPETIKVTGIDPAILKGQPTIERVLPQFHRFCEDTVLVAHNAAFDMRFLQLKEERTGVKFTQPVLDTLLLSAVVQPNINANGLEAIAERFGIDVMGRHTALGDAIMTAEIFLKMIPLLADRGIVTLKDAREASQKTFQARIQY